MAAGKSHFYPSIKILHGAAEIDTSQGFWRKANFATGNFISAAIILIAVQAPCLANDAEAPVAPATATPATATPATATPATATPATATPATATPSPATPKTAAAAAAAPGGQKATVQVMAVHERPFTLGSKVSRGLQTISGVNLVTQLVAGIIASKVAEKKLGGHVKVTVRVYSLTDLIAGKIKSVTVRGRGCALKEVPLGDVAMSSNGPIWFDWRRRNGKVTGLSAPITLSVSSALRQQDVCNAIASEALANSLRGLKLDVPGLGEQQLQVLKPRVALDERRITIDSRLITKGADPDTGIDLTISAVPVLDGSKIFLREMKVSCPDIIDPDHFSKFVEDLFNPIVDFGKFDRANRAFRLTSFVVEREQIIGRGNLLLVPRASITVKPSATIIPVK